jgi:hypothetical protein
MTREHAITATLVLAGALLLGCLALAGCASNAPSGEGPQLLGVVTSANTTGEVPQVLVVWDEGLGPRLEFDAASLAVPDSADVFRRNADGSYKRIAAEDLKTGDIVEVRITGPVRESYPVQADADQVVVVGEWPESKPLPIPPGLVPPPTE